jgi:hypothetical protein
VSRWLSIALGDSCFQPGLQQAKTVPAFHLHSILSPSRTTESLVMTCADSDGTKFSS